MKLAHYLLALLFLQISLACHGTEVGNGRSVTPGNKAEENKSPEPVAGIPDTPVASESKAREYLFVSCASPAAEMASGTYVSAEESFVFTRTGNDWTAKIVNATADFGHGTIPTPAQEYEITSNSGLAYNCESIVTETKKRTVTFSSGYKLIWTLDSSNEVDKITLFHPQGALLRTFQKQ